MTWTYRQSDGELAYDGELICHAYSGFGEGKNNSSLEWKPNVGPIPRGRYIIGPDMGDYGNKKAPVMRLTPDGHSACGRSGFLIHGDNLDHTASHGCIIVGRVIRQMIADSPDKELEVT
jgi:hypothetical protein